MFKKIKIKINGIRSQNDKVLIETEIDVLAGVINIKANEKSGGTAIEFDNSLIAQNRLLEKIEELGFQVAKEGKEELPSLREHTYFVKGMHCASCEILIEKKLLTIKGIKSVDASTEKGSALVVYEGQRPSVNRLNPLFKKENYLFFDQLAYTGNETKIAQGKKGNDFFIILGTALLFIAAFFIFKNSGLANLINVNSASSLPTFFFLGLLAGISSCAALVGGLVLSMSKQWTGMYSENNTTLEKFQPHIMFNLGRIASYAILGGVIGALGSKLQISLTFTSFLTIAVSIMMIFLALQMLGVKAFRKFQFTMPKFITRHIVDETNFQGKYMPALVGALTFFLPCGFTITAQGLALISGSAIQGALIMLFFSLGTLPGLAAIGLSTVSFYKKPHLSYKFLKIAGVLVLFFAFYNINSQLNVLGFISFSDLGLNPPQQAVNNVSNNETGLAPLTNGKQIIKMNASSSGYEPNYFKVKAGIPVRWEITDTGTSGCTNAVISNSLFAGSIPLTPGQVSVKEFTPEKPGKYKFSCWMGMISGLIEVVDDKAQVNIKGVNAQEPKPSIGDANVIPSGAKGCGCGGGSSCSTK